MNNEQFTQDEILEALESLYDEMASPFDYEELTHKEANAMNKANKVLACVKGGHPKNIKWKNQWEVGREYRDEVDL